MRRLHEESFTLLHANVDNLRLVSDLSGFCVRYYEVSQGLVGLHGSWVEQDLQTFTIVKGELSGDTGDLFGGAGTPSSEGDDDPPVARSKLTLTVREVLNKGAQQNGGLLGSSAGGKEQDKAGGTTAEVGTGAGSSSSGARSKTSPRGGKFSDERVPCRSNEERPEWQFWTQLMAIRGDDTNLQRCSVAKSVLPKSISYENSNFCYDFRLSLFSLDRPPPPPAPPTPPPLTSPPLLHHPHTPPPPPPPPLFLYIKS